MAETVDEPLPGRVVRFVAALDPDAVPLQLPVPHRMSAAARVAVAVALLAGSALGGVGIASLWIAPTPGWWFSVLFTVFISGLVVACWSAYAVSIRRADKESAARARWGEIASSARAEDAVISDRVVNLGEQGDVLSFVVTATTARGEASGRWEPGEGIRRLLQPQLPGIGAPVVVWRVDGETPLVIDVVDPTRVG